MNILRMQLQCIFITFKRLLFVSQEIIQIANLTKKIRLKYRIVYSCIFQPLFKHLKSSCMITLLKINCTQIVIELRFLGKMLQCFSCNFFYFFKIFVRKCNSDYLFISYWTIRNIFNICLKLLNCPVLIILQIQHIPIKEI